MKTLVKGINRLKLWAQSEDPRGGKRLKYHLSEDFSRKRHATYSEGDSESDSASDKDEISIKRQRQSEDPSNKQSITAEAVAVFFSQKEILIFQ